MQSPSFDVQVVGGGIVARTLALSLSRLGLSVALRAEAFGTGTGALPAAAADVRAYALNAASIALLSALKVWESLPADAATPVHDMRVHGDGERAELDFSAWEQRVRELAVITDASALEDALSVALRFAPHVTLVEREVVAPLTAHCEGRDAAARKALGAGFERHDYGHRAVAARLVASRPHAHVARQWFGAPDVLALLPFDRPEPSRSYALVWSLPAKRASALLAMDEGDFAAALGTATGGEAGALQLASSRAAWPLAVGRAEPVSGPGWVLLGDAAHVVHPLAGQGLNLGLADVAALTEVLAGRETWRSPGDERLLRRYVRRRAAPTEAMMRITDGLLRLFAREEAPLRELRNNGLTLVNHLVPLKRWLTARALGSTLDATPKT